MTRTRAAALALVAATLAAAAPARAGERGTGTLYAIEDRALMGAHEFTLALGALPADAFTKGLTVHGSYTYHFTPLLAWEVLGGLWSFNFDTGLKDDLARRFDVEPTEVGQLRWILDSSVVFTPLYGKLALGNRATVAGEVFLTAGYALGGFTAATPSGINAGAGVRVFLGRHLSLRLDVRDFLFFPSTGSVENHVYFALGLSLTFGFPDQEGGG